MRHPPPVLITLHPNAAWRAFVLVLSATVGAVWAAWAAQWAGALWRTEDLPAAHVALLAVVGGVLAVLRTMFAGRSRSGKVSRVAGLAQPLADSERDIQIQQVHQGWASHRTDQLAFDGREWQLLPGGSFDGALDGALDRAADSAVPVRVTVAIDLGRWMLLRCVPSAPAPLSRLRWAALGPAAQSRWHAVSAAQTGPAWPRLRAVLHAGPSSP